MKMSIATISLSGDLVEKLEAAASAGFAGVEVFDNDRQRAEAVRCLEAQGYTFEDGVWQLPRIGGAQPTLEGDAIHAMYGVRRVETIAGRAGHEVELDCLTIAINAYEFVRWRAWAMPQSKDLGRG